MLKKRRLSNSRFDMTLPDERYRAVSAARELLIEIANPSGRWKRVPKELRLHAIHCLRHYPSDWDMEIAEQQAPTLFQKRMEPLTRMLEVYKIEQKEEQNGNSESSKQTQ
jgi:hypothetical protein